MGNISPINNTEKCVPKLRFPGYDGEWSRKILSEISFYSTSRKSDIKQNYISTENMEQNCGGIRRFVDNSEIDGISFTINDILLANIRPYLKKAWLADFDGICSSDVLVMKSKNVHPKFLYSIISCENFFAYVMSGAKGSKMPRGDKSHIMNYTTAIPSYNEQQKIASFLTLLEKRIVKQQELVENLKSYKRGMLSAVLNQRIHITDSSEWRSYKLNDILKERKTYAEKGGKFEHVTLSKDGISGKTDRYDRDHLVSSNDKKYKITKFGDLCYNPANLKFGVICLNTYGDAIFSPIYVTFEISSAFNMHYIGYCLTTADFIKRALKFQQGTVYERMAVSPEDLLSMEILCPDIKTQNYIVEIIEKTDQKLCKEDDILRMLKKQRRVLLQQLFI